METYIQFKTHVWNMLDKQTEPIRSLNARFLILMNRYLPERVTKNVGWLINVMPESVGRVNYTGSDNFGLRYAKRQLYHTCGVYNPCDKPYLYQTGDDLSNTSGQNFFYTALRFNTSVTYFRRFASTFNVTISTTKIDIKWILSKI